MSGPPVRATATTFEILEALVGRDGAGVTELARELDHSKGSVHNHLSTLAQLGYVVADDGTYRLGLRFLDLGADARARSRLYREGREEARRLADSSGETVSLVARETGDAVVIARFGADGPGPRRVGTRLPLHRCAAGRVLLASDPSATSTHSRQVAETADPPNWDAIERELQTVRDQGIAFDRGELDADRRRVAAPITDENGRAVGALVIAGPADRLSGKRLEEDLPGLVLSGANAVTVALSKRS